MNEDARNGKAPGVTGAEGALRVLPSGPVPRISSLLIKPVSALCNLACSYCFYLDRDSDPYKAAAVGKMNDETLAALIRKYLEYSYPQTVFAWQGGEPTLAGVDFFEKACRLQQRYGAAGQSVGNSLQTNAVLLDERWCDVLNEYNFLLGVSLDGPENVHDFHRVNRAGDGSWRKVMQSIELLQRRGVEFNILSVVSQANVRRAKDVYRFYRKLGVAHIQYIPLAEFDSAGEPLPWTVTPREYGRFLVETFRLWWPNRRRVRIRLFDNIAEGLAGLLPGNCALQGSCDSYCVIEHNGDAYPCDFFVREEWKLGNVADDSFDEIARRARRFRFAGKKSVPHPTCEECKYLSLCLRGCPKLREGRRGRFEDLDYFCEAYRMIFRTAVPKLRKEVEKLGARACEFENA